MQTNVSRETIYKNLLLKWQKSVNLISPNTVDEIDTRHIKDSSQLAKFIPENSTIIDLGSGAGLPGIPLAISTGKKTFLVESDRKKSLFMQEAIRELNLDAIVINERIEKAKMEISGQVVITARALAELKKLFDLINSFLENNNIASYKLLLLKGRNVEDEIVEAKKFYNFELQFHPSETGSDSSILVVEGLRKV